MLTSYLVSNAIVLPVTGWLAPVFGRKRFLIALHRHVHARLRPVRGWRPASGC